MSDSMHNKTNSQLAQVFRQGAIAASVWRKERADGFRYFDFSLSRSWQSKDGEKEGYSTNYFASNEAELTTVIQDACNWMAQHQGELSHPPPEEGTCNEPTAATA